jgi:hypothetical protein
MNRLFNLSLNLHRRVRKIDESIQRVCDCTFKGVLNRHNPVVGLTALYQAENIFNRRFMDVACTPAKVRDGRQMRIRAFRT